MRRIAASYRTRGPAAVYTAAGPRVFDLICTLKHTVRQRCRIPPRRRTIRQNNRAERRYTAWKWPRKSNTPRTSRKALCRRPHAVGRTSLKEHNFCSSLIFIKRFISPCKCNWVPHKARVRAARIPCCNWFKCITFWQTFVERRLPILGKITLNLWKNSLNRFFAANRHGRIAKQIYSLWPAFSRIKLKCTFTIG